MSRHWYVLTGAPSSGKSTLLAELSSRGYATIAEQGKQEIDHQLAAGKRMSQIKVDSINFELAWTDRQLRREAEADDNQPTFLDRGLIDTMCYFKYYGWKVPETIHERCARADYQKVFLLEMLDYKTAYFRIESEKTARKMQDLLAEAYIEAGYEIIRIPALPLVQRIKMILNTID